MTVKLHVGYVGVTREGYRTVIVGPTNNLTCPFESTNGYTYTKSGRNQTDGTNSPLDIIGPWIAHAAANVNSPIEITTQTNLVNGKYGEVHVCYGYVGVYSVGTQAGLEAAIDTLIIIRDAKVLK